ncbi:hypothetical protein [Prevotella sp. HUN102]|uniref:hypothetical protein n=1 Tax=Prevotella sp. HUN102 TaxID=1392486 RepID=UPI00048C8553|nr:hypothetical protein [Prevotella sp. HUN102]
MKKIFTLAAVLLMSAAAMAQNAKSMIQFVDAKGNVIADGATFVANNIEADPFDDTKYQIKPEIFVKNVSEKEIPVAVRFDLTNMPNGELVSCFGECRPFTKPGAHESAYRTLNSGQNASLETEWKPDNSDPATWEATFTACLGQEVDGGFITTYKFLEAGPSIKVKFIYDVTGIENVNNNLQVKEVARFNAQGQKITEPCKGINIVKLSNGKTVKQLIK